MSEVPTVSVVIPAYNAERTLLLTIRSLYELDYPADRVELLIVDNRSTDATARILAEHSSRVRALQQAVPGAGPARNVGVREARNSIIAFTDADCIVDRAWLRNLVAPLEDPQVGISGGKVRAVRPCNAIQEYGEWLHDHERAIRQYQPPYAVTANWASRRSVVLDAGGFDERLRGGEDVDLAFRILQAGLTIAYRDDAVIEHHMRSSMRALYREGYRDGFYSVAVLKKHRDFVAGFGHRRGSWKSYRVLARHWMSAARRRENALCEAVFNSGKKAGKLAGSLRFGYFQP